MMKQVRNKEEIKQKRKKKNDDEMGEKARKNRKK